MDQDERMMRAALREAERGIGLTSPNPAVGAIITRNGEIIGRGFHRKAGEPHAEIEAIRSLPEASLARGATIYVTLEPCSTHGRTPPCVEAIIGAEFGRVVVGAIDPNPSHAGRGATLLRAAGIEVREGVLAEECTGLNHAFNKWITTGTPWVIAKAGMTLDGRLTRPPGEGQWITSEEARADAQFLRRRADAILIGANTLRTDNPRLTLRGAAAEGKMQPWRVVWTRGGEPLPTTAHLFNDQHRDRTMVHTGTPLAELLRNLAATQKVTCLLIEGGMQVLGEAFDQRLVDEVCFYMAPLLSGGPVAAIGGEGAPSSAAAPAVIQPVYERIGPDLKMSGRLHYPG